MNNPRFAIRPAAPDDAAIIRNLVRAAYAKWMPLIGREPLPMIADYDRAVREHDIDILFVDGKMVGVLEMIMHPDHYWIENVAIEPESQGKGWGRHLLAHAERKAVAAARHEIRLITNGAFETNIALYKAFGYGIDRTEPFRNGTAVYMRKPL